MKKTFTLATLIFIAFTVNGQHATYSRSNVVKKHVDILQLVSNVSNTNHLLVITPQSKVVINILNSLLEQVSKIETPIKISEEATINIITNKDEYFLFTNVPNTRKNGLWRINAKGDIEDLIVPYTKMLDFLFSESNGTLRMVTDNHQIFFLSHFHYPRLRKIVTTQVRVDNKMKVLESRKVAYDFKPSAEKLHEIKLLDANNLLVLKTGVDTNSNRRLQLVKVNFATGVGEIATYNTGSLILFNPHLHTTPADSTIIIYATIGALRSRQNLFFGKVNKSFTNVEAPSILQKDIPNNYVLVKDGNQKWLFFTATLTGGRLIYNDQSNYSSKNFADRIIESNTWWNSYSSSGE
ncbi:MAG: hypothetical protein JWQ96_1012, partial [Segetibacter sp.]|nr:hypothetical protein [Segetibacter sp.]